MRTGSFTYFKSWRNANILLLGLAILITGFTPVAKPIFEFVTHQAAVDTAASDGNWLISEVPIATPIADVFHSPSMFLNQPDGVETMKPSSSNEFLPVSPGCTGLVTSAAQGSFVNGFSYEFITDGNDVTVNIELLDVQSGLVAFIQTMNPNFAEVMMTNTGGQNFSRTFTNQTQGAPFNFAIKFAWAAGGLAVSEQLNFSVGDCQINPPVDCSGTFTSASQGSFNNGFSYEFITDGNDVTVNVELLDVQSGLVAFIQTMNPNFAEVMMTNTGGQTFSTTFTNQTQGAPFNFAIKFAWAAAGLAVSDFLSFTVGDCPAPVPSAPTTNSPDPTCDAAEVINIYSSAYPTNIVTNYNPNWGQSGFCCVNTAYDPGTGNVVLAYTNFNYQGTELTPTNASAMEFFHVDVWTNANPAATTLQVSPINFGTGPAEILVTIPFVQGQWTSVVLPKSAFAGMTWDDIRQLKFAANGPNSLTPVDIYLDNIFFSTTGCGTSTGGTTDITFCVDYSCVAETPGFAAQQIFFDGGPFDGFRPLTNTGNNIWCGTFALPAGGVRYNYFFAGAAGAGGPENLSSPDVQSCVSTGVTGLKRTYTVVEGNSETLTFAWESCSSTPDCPPPSAPTDAPPTPTCLQENVISLFSNSYTNVGVDTWLTPWSGATGGGIVSIAGNDTRLYNNVNFIGIETTGANLIDASEMATFHIDIWTPNMTTFRVKLVDFGANGGFGGGDDTEGELSFTPMQGGWNSYEIPMDDFQAVGLTNRANIAQFILSGIPVGQGTLYIDNVYFSKENCEVPCLLTVTCNDLAVSFNGQNSIALEASQLATVSSNCGIQSISLSPNTIFSNQIGQTVPVVVTVTDNSGNTASCTSLVTSGGLPSGWSQNANGVGCSNGNNIAYSPATQVWTATSTNCFYAAPFNSDASAFAQYTLCGDGSITAQVTGISGTSLGWAGVVMREDNSPGAKKAQLTTNLSNFSRREFRTITNGSATPQQFPSQNRYWMRLVRTGNQFVMYLSANGISWSFAGAQNIQMNSCIQVGLVVTNYTPSSTVTATFANVSVTGNTGNFMAGESPNQVNTTAVQAAGIVNVFPNPTSGELNVSLMGYTGRPVALEVYSTMGQLLYVKEIDELNTGDERIDLSSFANGMYLIRVTSEGLPTVMKRITVTK